VPAAIDISRLPTWTQVDPRGLNFLIAVCNGVYNGYRTRDSATGSSSFWIPMLLGDGQVVFQSSTALSEPFDTRLRETLDVINLRLIMTMWKR
jgi:hypothetical protein